MSVVNDILDRLRRAMTEMERSGARISEDNTVIVMSFQLYDDFMTEFRRDTLGAQMTTAGLRIFGLGVEVYGSPMAKPNYLALKQEVVA